MGPLDCGKQEMGPTASGLVPSLPHTSPGPFQERRSLESHLSPAVTCLLSSFQEAFRQLWAEARCVDVAVDFLCKPFP